MSAVEPLVSRSASVDELMNALRAIPDLYIDDDATAVALSNPL
jgi:hypothetical protein